jgi:hypothetical protein
MSTLTPEQDAAYEIWASTGARSDAKTAEITGVPRRTIAHWRTRYAWRDRYLSLASEEAEAIARTAVVQMRQGMDLVTERLLDIVGSKRPQRRADGTILTDETGEPVLVWASKDGDAIKASQILAQYALGSPQSQAGLDTSIPTTYREVLPAETYQLPEPEEAGEGDLASLRAAAAQMLEETAMRVNTRVEPGRRRGERV